MSGFFIDQLFAACMVVMLLSIFLSGFMFPRETMPLWAYLASHLVPATYMIQIARGVILRGTGLAQLWINGLVLFAMGVVLLLQNREDLCEKTWFRIN